ncbi:Selenoprotein V [Apodemus speciosus]|uniref:Selenoprotein V n=1 Tax=Apodemus speciosus TaxID=105296 RepID=A0ABQ0EY24_APOSI
MNNKARIPAPSSTRANTPSRTPAPIRTATPVRAPGPARHPTSVRNPARVRTPAQVPNPAPIRFPTPAPAPAPTLTPAPAPAPVPAAAPVRTPAPVRPSNLGRVFPTISPARFFPSLASPTAQPISSGGASSLAKDPTLAQKQRPSIPSLAEAVQGPLPVLTPSDSKTRGSLLDPAPAVDPLASTAMASSTLKPVPGPNPTLEFLASPLKDTPDLGRLATITPAPSFVNTKEGPSTSEDVPPANRILIRVMYWDVVSEAMYIILKRTLEHQFPNLLEFEEERATQVTGEFEVFVDGKLIHSKKKGDGFVDESGMKKLMGAIDEEIKKR